ncbi:hypothetical protein CVV38_00735 [Candidatus Peregrinibacteria bacterium HGW-Peregrinibacteria-1]|jgi:hypothetical protein|nr:MAG: hypothetical protein CVV38_00735 [Candidatus Peregrinibacteria bacterium HGW-Peregrinibacteria-1]
MKKIAILTLGILAISACQSTPQQSTENIQTPNSDQTRTLQPMDPVIIGGYLALAWGGGGPEDLEEICESVSDATEKTNCFKNVADYKIMRTITERIKEGEDSIICLEASHPHYQRECLTEIIARKYLPASARETAENHLLKVEKTIMEAPQDLPYIAHDKNLIAILLDTNPSPQQCDTLDATYQELCRITIEEMNNLKEIVEQGDSKKCLNLKTESYQKPCINMIQNDLPSPSNDDNSTLYDLNLIRALRQNDTSKCDQLADPSQKEPCVTAINLMGQVTLALEQLDTTICEAIPYEKISATCDQMVRINKYSQESQDYIDDAFIEYQSGFEYDYKYDNEKESTKTVGPLR